MKPGLIGFGLIMGLTSLYSLATGRSVPFARGWKPHEQPSRGMRWIGLLGLAAGIWTVVASLIGIMPIPPFSRL